METAAPNVAAAPKGRKSRHKAAEIRPYDFRQPAFLAPTELRKLRQRHDEFVRALASRLSMYLRLEVGLQVAKLGTVCYQNFIETLSTPAHVVMFKAEPLKGICLLDIPPRLGLTIVDRLLGGPAHAPIEHRDLTEIETALLDQAVQIILNEWCQQWQAFETLRPALLGHESNGRFLQTAPHDAVMVSLAIEMRIGDCTEQMQIVFPHYTMEPLVKYLTALSVTEKDAGQTSPPSPAAWNPELGDVPVPVSAAWSGLELTGRELMALKPGDVLMLDPQITQSVHVHVASTPKYVGRLGTRGANWAVEVTQPLTM
jgi:flagellar motor switch protein FliM